MIGTTCFLGFFILSQRLHRPVKWGFDPLAGFGMGLLASLSIGSVLSNGTFVVGACFGFGLIDLFRRHWRVFVARVLFMVGGATFLVAFHPVTRHLEKLEQFNHMFGLKVGEWETPLGVTGRYLSDVLWPYPILLGSLAVLGFLTWIIRKNLLWIPIVTILLTIVGVVWWGQNYQFSRSYMTLTILVILLIQGFGEGVLALLERYTKPVVVWVASGLLVVAGLAGWSAQYEGIQESYAGWVFGIDTHEWHAQSAPYSIEMMPWDIYQGYYYDHPDVEDKIARLYEQRKIGQIQLLSFIGTPPIITGSPSLPEVPIPVLTPGEVIGDTGRQRWTFSDVHYLDEWQSQPPEPLQEACDFCFVLLLTKAGMWFHPEFGEVPVSGLHFNRPYEESEMAGHLIFGHVVPNPADLPAAVARLQQTDAYVGPVRAFVVGF